MKLFTKYFSLSIFTLALLCTSSSYADGTSWDSCNEWSTTASQTEGCKSLMGNEKTYEPEINNERYKQIYLTGIKEKENTLIFGPSASKMHYFGNEKHHGRHKK